MIPLVKPRDGLIINLLTISRVTLNPANGSLRVVYTDGQSEVFEGDAARLLDAELAFAMSEYRMYQQAYQQAVDAQKSQIITPDKLM